MVGDQGRTAGFERAMVGLVRAERAGRGRRGRAAGSGVQGARSFGRNMRAPVAGPGSCVRRRKSFVYFRAGGRPGSFCRIGSVGSIVPERGGGRLPGSPRTGSIVQEADSFVRNAHTVSTGLGSRVRAAGNTYGSGAMAASTC